ncbi:sensor histidine kinase [Actinomadura flavalba]|uniref:sensor histidine kinase n=1 Tax=Actinomadura flavalba TaxID=1120938 RepID=UPI000366F42A|nr:HAMP domain-containing sensor histidine kinase [Actinomadura flavalba]
MRVRPRSIRTRDTVISAVLAALVFGCLAVAVDVAVRTGVRASVLAETQHQARKASGAARDGSLAFPLWDDTGGRTLVQVVAPDGRVLGGTPSAQREARLSHRWPPPDHRVQDYTECRDTPGPGDRCRVIEAIRVSTDEASPVVYAARAMPAYLSNGTLEAALAALVLLLSAVAAWVTWRVVGHTLRPVALIRSQLAEISGSDLSGRVVQPPGEDEIAQLARTANQTLDRLERAVARQRQFSSDASHELRTPIAGLRANLEDAAMHPDDTDLGEVVRSALRDTDRVESIITDLLLLARIGTGGSAAHETVDLGALTCAEITRRAVPPTAVLAENVRVRGVRMQLARLLTNLLDNAERYAGGGVEVQVRRTGPDALLTVTDDGPGIPPADRERVFERFTRLDSARSRGAGGTGLGLAIAREIARAHDGDLTIETAPRQGARLVLRLPLER